MLTSKFILKIGPSSRIEWNLWSLYNTMLLDGIDQGCPTFSSRGPHLLHGISMGAATNNSNQNGVLYPL